MLESQANAKKEVNWLSFIFTLSLYLTKSYRVSTINKYNVSLMQLYAFLIFTQSSCTLAFPLSSHFLLCCVIYKMATYNKWCGAGDRGMKCSFRPEHVQPPSSLSTRCFSRMEKCPKRHQSPTLGSATTRFPFAVISAERSWREGLATGCHGNWAVCLMPLAWVESLFFSARIQVALRALFHSCVKDMSCAFVLFLSPTPSPPSSSDWSWVTLQVLLSLSFLFLLSCLLFCFNLLCCFPKANLPLLLITSIPFW